MVSDSDFIFLKKIFISQVHSDYDKSLFKEFTCTTPWPLLQHTSTAWFLRRQGILWRLGYALIKGQREWFSSLGMKSKVYKWFISWGNTWLHSFPLFPQKIVFLTIHSCAKTIHRTTFLREHFKSIGFWQHGQWAHLLETK